MVGIRPAIRDDAWGVARVHEAARAAYYGFPPSAELDPERVSMWWAVIAERGRATVLVAEEDGELVGFVSFGPPIHQPPGPGQAVELQALYVLPDDWETGIASALYQRFLERLPEDALGILDVWTGNARAIGFYEHRGWRRDGRSRPGPEGSAYVGMSLRRGR